VSLGSTVTLVGCVQGRIGLDVTLSGDAVATFWLEVDRGHRKNGNGGSTTFKVRCFRGLAKHVAASLHHADRVVVVGKLDSYRTEGGAHVAVVIVATDVGASLAWCTAQLTPVERWEHSSKRISSTETEPVPEAHAAP
jgi:single-strand DNA-binding protein